MRAPRGKPAGYLATAIPAIIWGSNGVIVNLIALDSYQIAFFRVAIASLVLAPAIAIFRWNEFAGARRFLGRLLLNGLLLCLGWAFLFASMKLIPIASAVLLNYLAPIFTAMLAPILLKERLGKLVIPSFLLSIMGLFLISYNDVVGGPSNFLGVVYGLLAGLSYAGFIISSKKLRENISSPVVALYSYVFASIFLATTLAYEIPAMQIQSIILLLILGSINTAFAVTLYFYGLGLIEAHRAVIMTYLEPVSASIFGAIFLGQIPSPLMAVGGLLIIFAGYLVARD